MVTLFTNARIATMASGSPYGLLEAGAVLTGNGLIQWLGPARDAPAAETIIDCANRLITPGLIDCHTHIIHGGSRAEEFELRLNGVSYVEIAEAGGGIVSTVKATRAATEHDLIESALPRLDALLAQGVTTIEIKSGYGLDVETELKMLRAARALGALRSVDVVTSFLGAHALPPEFAGDSEAYIDFVCRKSLPAAANAGLADAVDGFCEKIAFTPDQIAKVFRAAQAFDLPVKLHAEQLSNLGGAALAARHRALSVDHVEYIDPPGVEAIAASGTCAVLLPGAFYYLQEKQKPPVKALRAANVPMALATDLNPGSSPVYSLLTAMNMACVLFALTPEEALRAVTVNAALALGLADRGRIAPGLKADMAVWAVDRPGDLAYALGHTPLAASLKGGRIVHGAL